MKNIKYFKTLKKLKYYRLPDPEEQFLTVRLLQFKDVIRRKPYPIAIPHQAKQTAVHRSNSWTRKQSLFNQFGLSQVMQMFTIVQYRLFY